MQGKTKASRTDRKLGYDGKYDSEIIGLNRQLINCSLWQYLKHNQCILKTQIYFHKGNNFSTLNLTRSLTASALDSFHTNHSISKRSNKDEK